MLRAARHGRHHEFGHLFALVEKPPGEFHEAEFGPARGSLCAQHLRLEHQHVARPHGLHPAAVVAARSAQIGRPEDDGFREQPHGNGAHLPAGGGKTAEHGMFRGFFVEMMGLRIEFARKCEDLIFGDAIRPAEKFPADGEIFEVKEFFAHEPAVSLFSAKDAKETPRTQRHLAHVVRRSSFHGRMTDYARRVRNRLGVSLASFALNLTTH